MTDSRFDSEVSVDLRAEQNKRTTQILNSRTQTRAKFHAVNVAVFYVKFPI